MILRLWIPYGVMDAGVTGSLHGDGPADCTMRGCPMAWGLGPAHAGSIDALLRRLDRATKVQVSARMLIVTA